MSKKLLILAGASLSGVVAFGLLFTWILSPDYSESKQLQLACQWLDDGRWELAEQLTKDLEPYVDPEADTQWLYVKGVSIVVRAADEIDSYQNHLKLYEAIDLLEKSRELGFPLGYRGKGNYHLGVCLYHTYQWPQAIERLNESMIDYPQGRGEALKMIFSGRLRQPSDHLQAAHEALDRWRGMPGLSALEIDQTYIAHARLELARKQPAQCFDWLNKIQPNSSQYAEAQQWQAIALIELSKQSRDSKQRDQHLSEAQAILKRLVVSADTPKDIRRQSFFLSGQVLRYQGRLTEAISVLSGARQQNPLSAEAITAALEEAEVLLQLKRFSEVIVSTRHLFTGIKDIRFFNEYWVSKDELRTRLMDIGNGLRELEQYPLALELADQLRIVFPPIHALRLQSSTLAKWAAVLEAEAAAGTVEPARSAEMFNHAAQRYEQLSMQELQSKDYLNLIWTAAQCYHKANQLDQANRMLETYLQYESRTKRARGYLALGRNYATKGQWKSSLEILQRCIRDYPQHPSSYEARYLAARGLAESGDIDAAIEMLQSNLWDHDLSPESPVWRDSFVELGTLIFQRAHQKLYEVQSIPDKTWEKSKEGFEISYQDFIQAANQLGEAVKRYPKHPPIYQAHYLLARSYQLAAETPRQASSLNATLSTQARRKLRIEENELLEKAAIEYRRLHQSISALAESTSTSAIDEAILRNAHFGEADVLHQLSRFDEAIESYRLAAAKFPNQPETLEALVQIAECHRKMGRDTEARKAIRQAESVLQRIPAELDSKFVSVTRGDRSHWQKMLGTLKDWN